MLILKRTAASHRDTVCVVPLARRTENHPSAQPLQYHTFRVTRYSLLLSFQYRIALRAKLQSAAAAHQAEAATTLHTIQGRWFSLTLHINAMQLHWLD